MKDDQRKAMFAKGSKKGHGIKSTDLNSSELKAELIPKEFGGVKLSNTQRDMLGKLANNETVLTEGDVNYIKNTYNGTYSNDHGRREEPISAYAELIQEKFGNNEDGFKLTQEQTNKGLEWLKKSRIYKNTFGDRERAIYDNFKEFRLVDFTDRGNNYYRQYIPVYRVISKDGNHFDYHITAMDSQASISIVG